MSALWRDLSDCSDIEEEASDSHEERHQDLEDEPDSFLNFEKETNEPERPAAAQQKEDEEDVPQLEFKVLRVTNGTVETVETPNVKPQFIQFPRLYLCIHKTTKEPSDVNEDPNSVRRYMLDRTDGALLFFRFLSIKDVALNCCKVSTLWCELSQLHLQHRWRLPCPLLSRHLQLHPQHSQQAVLLSQRQSKAIPTVAWLPVPNAHNMRASISHLPEDTRMMLVRPSLQQSGQWQVDIVDFTERTTAGFFPKTYRRPVRWQRRRLHRMTHRDDFFVDWRNDRYGLVSVNGEGECTLVWHSMYDDDSEEANRLRMRLGYAVHADFRTSPGGSLVAVTPNHVFVSHGDATVDTARSAELRVSPCGTVLARVSDHVISVTRVSDGTVTRYTVADSERSDHTVRDVCIDDTGVYGLTRAIVSVEGKRGTARVLRLLAIALDHTGDVDLDAAAAHVVTLPLRPKENVPRVRLDSLTGNFRIKLDSNQAAKWTTKLNGIDVFVHEDDCDFKLPSGYIKGSYMSPVLRLHDHELRPVLPFSAFVNNRNVRNGIALDGSVVAIGGTCLVVPVAFGSGVVVLVKDVAVLKQDAAVPFSQRHFSTIFSKIAQHETASRPSDTLPELDESPEEAEPKMTRRQRALAKRKHQEHKRLCQVGKHVSNAKVERIPQTQEYFRSTERPVLSRNDVDALRRCGDRSGLYSIHRVVTTYGMRMLNKET
ncbi:MAG: hypothetical protein MHM6MM_007659 [Cercozoa sp. M6MM]